MTTEKKKLRIAFLVRNFPSMSESFVLQQITGMLDRGHTVEIFAQRNPEQPVVHESVHRYSLLGRTRYLPSIPQHKGRRRVKTAALIGWCLCRHPIDLFRLLKAAFRRRGGFDYVCFYYGICCVGRRYDLFHGHFGPAGEAAVLLRKAGFGKAAVTTFHGFDVTSYVKKYGRAVYQQLLEEGDLFTYNSEQTKQRVLELGGPPDRMTKLRMGVDLSHISFSERHAPAEGPVRILSVGRLEKMKGRRYAIEAVAEVMRRYPNLEYVIVGDGSLRPSLEQQIEQTGFSDKIHLRGWIADEELDQLYKTSHIFLHPSITASDGNQEGQGVVLVEAQAYGLVVVATDHGAFPETVRDGRSGFLVPEKDAAALRDCLLQVLSRPQDWPEIGRQGRRHAETHYNIEQLNDQLEELYNQVLRFG